MKFVAWVLGWLWVVLTATGAFGAMTLGIFDDGGENEPWGELSAMFFLITAVSAIGMGAWTTANYDSTRRASPERTRRLPREQRQALRKAEADLQLKRAIEDLEYENLR